MSEIHVEDVGSECLRPGCNEKATFRRSPKDSAAYFCSSTHFQEYITAIEYAQGHCLLFNRKRYQTEEAARIPQPWLILPTQTFAVKCKGCDNWHMVSEDEASGMAQFSEEFIKEALEPGRCESSLGKKFRTKKLAEFWKLIHHSDQLFNEVHRCNICNSWHVGMVEDSDCPVTHKKKFEDADSALAWYRSYYFNKDKYTPVLEPCICGSWHWFHADTTCPVPNKKIHDTWAEGEEHRMRLSYRTELHTYLCSCRKWHVGRIAFRKKREAAIDRSTAKKSTRHSRANPHRSRTRETLDNSISLSLDPSVLEKLNSLKNNQGN